MSTSARSITVAVAEEEVRRVLEEWARSTRTGELDRVLANHEPGAVMYDVLQPMKYEGVDAYRKSWDDWQPQTVGAFAFDLHDLEVTAGVDLAFAHAFIRCAGTTPDGHEFEDWVRATFCLRNRSDGWRVAHQHVSAPRT